MVNFHKFKKGSLYKIRFLDHCVGQDESMLCEVAGWVLKETEEIVVVTYWQVISDDKTIVEENIEPVTIIKSTIISKRKLS